ncbi:MULTISPECIES: DUF421 domain-containing protein [Syntrophomonas]|uniref:DUF421 domain-containing protein n=1 Tax=Syntrophomonas wolfei TaxID=863 RepID=A0A354YVD2_9FIRM|nr:MULTISPECIES: DUF421 domain-containing protein [Syntrophomonas]MDD4627576.1 DUF421 domain-containing protein [Syntrophomonas sp.]HBK52651.1 DUF421 domain-containing protein [Syntrophomonas wolfei]
MLDNIDIIFRNLIAVGILFLVTLVIGKKLISQLNFFDFIVGITIGSIAAALSVDKTITYSHGIISLLIWGLIPLVVAKIALADIRARRRLDGVPTLLVQNGKILEDNLKKEKYHVNDLLEELRLKGVFNIADLNFAILETSGQISVQLKPEKQPVTVSDLNLSATRQGLCANLIIDGKILYQHLKLVNRDEIWLREELKKQNIEDVGQVLLASMDGSGNLYIDVKDDQVKEFNVLK